MWKAHIPATALRTTAACRLLKSGVNQTKGVDSLRRCLRQILLPAIVSTHWFCGCALADEPIVDLIDAHGIKVAAIVPPAEGQELKANLDVTPSGRDLLLEARDHGDSRPGQLNLFEKLGDGDERAVIEAVGRCWRWYDHVNNNAEYPQEQLQLPEFSVSYEPVFYPLTYKNRHGICSDGYWLNFRKRQDSAYWWYDAGREFKGERAVIKVRLRFDHHENADYGEVLVDGKSVFRCKPGLDTCEGEFSRRFLRSRLWEQLDKPSFRLARDRLKLLLGSSQYEKLLAIIGTHPECLRYQITMKPGPSAATGFIKAIEVMEKNGLIENSNTSVDAQGRSGASALLLPGALLARHDLEGRLAVRWETSNEQTRESRFRVEYGELRKCIGTERSAYLYLIALQQAITCVRLSTPEEAKQIILGDLLAEAVLEFNLR